jgi:hypothetical protein
MRRPRATDGKHIHSRSSDGGRSTPRPQRCRRPPSQSSGSVFVPSRAPANCAPPGAGVDDGGWSDGDGSTDGEQLASLQGAPSSASCLNWLTAQRLPIEAEHVGGVGTEAVGQPGHGAIAVGRCDIFRSVRTLWMDRRVASPPIAGHSSRTHSSGTPQSAVLRLAVAAWIELDDTSFRLDHGAQLPCAGAPPSASVALEPGAE